MLAYHIVYWLRYCYEESKIQKSFLIILMKHNFQFIYVCGLQGFKLNKSLDIRMYSDCIFVREVNTFFKQT